MKKDTSYWEDKLPNEREKAFNYFVTYRDLGSNRSISLVRERHNNDITKRQLGNYSMKYHWRDRVEAFDEYNRLKQQRKDKEKFDEKARELEEKQEKVLSTLQTDTYDLAIVIRAAIQKIAIETGLIPNPKTGEFEINPKIKSTSAFNTLSNLIMANNSNQKSMLRAYELPETLNDKQDVSLEADVLADANISQEGVFLDLTSDEFMDRELEYMKRLLEESK